ncbi:N-acetylmuramate alpha-1-phosphate uridylyltransferase MurU [Pseudoalteromonas sp. MMG022]|uniref:N-acetylmuramate alpha-1-phosphate uridylyltransferase MurU n=1 Tax=Pseudoalteromonas sp. MMG022 TaxID=2909978 RepID=UPI001F3C0425|nr:nucleotidyltransferase family protein [Pseudoalteromonas sp. MMG022]MCF6435917.1 nucleotidyltransferase family protein [Pseudoalteromonas sp. MMG022]
MKAMILAAGRGKRMMPLTADLPKPMLPVAGRPLLEYHIERLRNAGITQIVINLAWQGEKIVQHFSDGSAFGVHIHYSYEPQEGLETAGGIRNALDVLSECDDTFIVINGDIFTDYDVSALTQLALGEQEAHIVLVENPAHNPQGDFRLAHQPLNEQRYTFAGIGLYHSSFFRQLAPGFTPLGPVLREALEQGHVSTELYLGLWSDIGTPERLSEINSMWEQQ